MVFQALIGGIAGHVRGADGEDGVITRQVLGGGSPWSGSPRRFTPFHPIAVGLADGQPHAFHLGLILQLDGDAITSPSMVL